MKTQRFANYTAYTAIAAGLALIIAACSSTKKQPENLEAGRPVQPVGQKAEAGGSFAFDQVRPADGAGKSVNDFRMLEGVLASVKQGDDLAARQFLSAQNNSAMGESVRNEWLKSLGKRGMAAQFQQEVRHLDPEGRSQEVKCYDLLFNGARSNDFTRGLWQETGRLPQGCNALLEQQARSRSYEADYGWRRVLGLLSSGQSTDAARLSAALGTPEAVAADTLRDVVSPSAQKNHAAAAVRLQELQNTGADARQTSFAWGVLGMAAAKSQNMAAALSYYGNATAPQLLSGEQLEWYARAGLRLQQWQRVAQAIDAMPEKLKNDAAWLYWRARSHAAQGDAQTAHALYRKAAQTGRNFYAVLATEELGGQVNARSNVGTAPKHQVDTLAKDGAVQRALALFHTSQQEGSWKMRRQAQAEWRYATRSMNEGTLLAAAQLAFNHQFYEMAIYSADKTNHQLNYNLRYITPFRDLVVQNAHANGIDAAWVYGLIRQESRFVMGAQSSVGAQGLMQVMPATAREIARKTGMSDSELYSIDGNIRMGTWYLADARRRLQNNEVLATAGYNAGPGRARQWQAGTPLEGAVYAETIPFTETRDYVKKVMTNAVYYAHLLGEPQTSLKQRMGRVPGR